MMQFWRTQFYGFKVQRFVLILLITTNILGGCAIYSPTLYMGNKKLETRLPPYEKLTISFPDVYSNGKNTKQIIVHEMSQNIFNPKATTDASSFKIKFLATNKTKILGNCLWVIPAFLFMPVRFKYTLEAKIVFYDISDNPIAQFSGSGSGVAWSWLERYRTRIDETSDHVKTAMSRALIMSIEEIKDKIQASRSELLAILKTPDNNPSSTPHNKLTETEKKVKIIQANQTKSMQLNHNCTIVTQIETFESKSGIRIHAEQNNANIAQILLKSTDTSTTKTQQNYSYSTETSQTTSYSVRFYRCTGNFYENVGSYD